MVEYPWSTLGPYRETILGLSVMYNGQATEYLTHLILDSNAPILVGREIYGFPKKMGHIEFVQQEDIRAGYVERPKGIRICSCVFRPEKPMDPLPDNTPLEPCSLRVIPSPEKDKDYSLVELIQTKMILSNTEIWSGSGNCHFTGASVLDPWHRLPIKKHLSATYMVADFILGDSKVLKRIQNL